MHVEKMFRLMNGKSSLCIIRDGKRTLAPPRSTSCHAHSKPHLLTQFFDSGAVQGYLQDALQLFVDRLEHQLDLLVPSGAFTQQPHSGAGEDGH